MKLKKSETPVPLEEVEPAKESETLTTGAMLVRSIQQGAHETLAIAMNRIRRQVDTGEVEKTNALHARLERRLTAQRCPNRLRRRVSA